MLILFSKTCQAFLQAQKMRCRIKRFFTIQAVSCFLSTLFRFHGGAAFRLAHERQGPGKESRGGSLFLAPSAAPARQKMFWAWLGAARLMRGSSETPFGGLLQLAVICYYWAPGQDPGLFSAWLQFFLAFLAGRLGRPRSAHGIIIMLTILDWAGHRPENRPRAVLTVGVFDGLHLGHQRLIGEVVERARRKKAASVVLTFDPHPLSVLSRAQAPEVLTTLPQKAEILEGMGLDILGRLEFNEALRMTGPMEFLRDIIEVKVQPVEIVVGPDFRFGRDAEGHVDLLADWAKSVKAVVTEIELQKRDDVLYSSSHVRRMLKMGLVDAAALSLGRPYRLAGRVVTGAARGRQLGFPTANLGEVAQLIPGPGVYAVRARLRGESHQGMTSVGHNPTFANQYLTVETYLFDFNDDIYGESLDVDFVGHLRGMDKFDGLESLVKQLGDDERAARKLLASRG